MTSRRGWLSRLLDRGEPPVVDPDEIVEAGYVSLVAAQIVMAQLAEAGIPAQCAEERQIPEAPALHARISCRVADVHRVRLVIDEVTTL